MQSLKKFLSVVFTAAAMLAAHAAAPASSTSSSTHPSTSGSSRSSKVDINTADEATLETLPGVGPQTAKAIIAARPFQNVSDLSRVSGIGEVKLKEIRPLVVASKAARAGAARSETESTVAPATTSHAKTAQTAASASTVTARAGAVNLNTASKEQLEELPEIGPVKAQAIIDARPFSSPEDVMRVKGIKEGTYNAIKPYISVR